MFDYVYSDLNRVQALKIWAVSNSQFREVWWFYCSAGADETDSYVFYNYQENHWEFGKLSRSCGIDRGVFPYPIWCSPEPVGTATALLPGYEYEYEYEGPLVDHMGFLQTPTGDQNEALAQAPLDPWPIIQLYDAENIPIMIAGVPITVSIQTGVIYFEFPPPGYEVGQNWFDGPAPDGDYVLAPGSTLTVLTDAMGQAEFTNLAIEGDEASGAGYNCRLLFNAAPPLNTLEHVFGFPF